LRCRFTLFACFPSAVRTLFGRREIVFFLRAARAAFLMFRRAAAFCLEVAMRESTSASPHAQALRLCNSAAA
jgi:hypothetical protein